MLTCAGNIKRMSKRVMDVLSTIPAARVVFKVKTSLDTHAVSCEMTESGQQGIKTLDHFCYNWSLGEPSTNRVSNPKDHLLSAGSY